MVCKLENSIKELLEFSIVEKCQPAKMTAIFCHWQFLQECERMNILTVEMRRSMRQLDLGLKGELTITPEMESLSDSLFLDQVPPSWTKRAYDSLNGLTAWYSDLLLRIKELEM